MAETEDEITIVKEEARIAFQKKKAIHVYYLFFSEQFCFYTCMLTLGPWKGREPKRMACDELPRGIYWGHLFNGVSKIRLRYLCAGRRGNPYRTSWNTWWGCNCARSLLVLIRHAMVSGKNNWVLVIKLSLFINLLISGSFKTTRMTTGKSIQPGMVILCGTAQPTSKLQPSQAMYKGYSKPFRFWPSTRRKKTKNRFWHRRRRSELLRQVLPNLKSLSVPGTYLVLGNIHVTMKKWHKSNY